MNIELSPLEARVLGALIEKEITTPDQYPLSLNALANACNQKTNRDPVLELPENTVQQTVDALLKKHLVSDRSAGYGGRVTKYKHRFCNTEFGPLRFSKQELGLICVLLLRGPQTPGELRGRTERMYKFDELSDVQTVLQKLMTRDPVLVKVLPRAPGTKEARYAHLLSGDVEGFEAPGRETVVYAASSSRSYAEAESYEGSSRVASQDETELMDRMAALEAEVAILARELGEVRAEVVRLTKMLE